MNDHEIDVLARTIYGEARGEYSAVDGGLASLIAVGNVIMNRLKSPERFGNSIQEVCHRPWQFSCWNRNDVNYGILKQEMIADPLFKICSDVAVKVRAREWPDLTKGCDHYHVTSLTTLPFWAKGQRPKLRLAGHIFYKLNEGE